MLTSIVKTKMKMESKIKELESWIKSVYEKGKTPFVVRKGDHYTVAVGKDDLEYALENGYELVK